VRRWSSMIHSIDDCRLFM